MPKGSAVSVYLDDETLKALDSIVEKQAAYDRAKGLTGYQVANRSKIISSIIADFLDHESLDTGLSIRDIKEIVTPIAIEYGVESLSVFGSYARGEETDESDVDLLLEKGKIKGVQVFDFKEDIERALRKKVDIVTTQGAGERFLSRIKDEGVLIYEARRAG